MTVAVGQRRSVSLTQDRSLTAVDVSKSFGGVSAISHVSLDLRAGQIHGLIGPNGSGKTTLLNLLCGYYPIDEGRILLDMEEFGRMDTASRARAGVSRTFQKPRLLTTLSVLDNVMLGGWPSVRAGFLASCLRLGRPRREERDIAARAEQVLHAMGFRSDLRRAADVLEHAEQRFVEIARTLMTGPAFILLDEPAGGLTEREIEALSTVIRAIAASGIGILLVEHHTDLVFNVCDTVTVLDLGKVLADGPPAAVRANDEVIRVYLGA